MTTTLEKAARATYAKWIEDVRDLEPEWDALPESHRARLIDATRAALLAIREPSEAILRAADPGTSDEDVPIDYAWPLAIDAILAEKPGAES